MPTQFWAVAPPTVTALSVASVVSLTAVMVTLPVALPAAMVMEAALSV